MEEKLFFEGEGKIRATTNYIILLTLATIIATYGVISASTATVIGAMIIAPLMTPIMATTLAIVLGASSRMSRSVLLVGISVLYVIGLAIVLSIFISSVVIDFGSNPEITSRVSPNLLALFVALGSGAAGAFAVSREDVGDTLPGVAIAISLVPPLSVVGIALSKAQWLDATGAFVLFLTNFLAIVIAGGAVFWFSGVSAGRIHIEEKVARKKAIQAAVMGILIVSFLLGFNGYRTLELDRDNTITWTTTENWLENTPYTITGITMTYQPSDIMVRGPADVTIGLAGTGSLPDLRELATDLEQNLGYGVTLEVRSLPEEILYYPEVTGAAA
jgi:uncharacterized hydrophobic protein (TIGR00271 family)